MISEPRRRVGFDSNRSRDAPPIMGEPALRYHEASDKLYIGFCLAEGGFPTFELPRAATTWMARESGGYFQARPSTY